MFIKLVSHRAFQIMKLWSQWQYLQHIKILEYVLHTILVFFKL
jgi:hypothetical protein